MNGKKKWRLFEKINLTVLALTVWTIVLGQPLAGRQNRRHFCKTYEVTQQILRENNITDEKIMQAFNNYRQRQVGQELPSFFYGTLGTTFFPQNGLVGTVRALHIMIEVSDPANQFVTSLKFDPNHRPGFYDNMLFNERNPDSMTNYWREASYGRFRLTGNTVGPVTVQSRIIVQTRQENNRTVIVIAYIAGPLQKMLQDALNSLDPIIDFSQYDSDHDGRIDALFVTWAADIRAKPPNGNLDLDPTATAFAVVWGQARRVNPTLPPFATTNDGVVVDGVVFSHEVFTIYGHDTFAHEMGHLFGLPDLYNTVNLDQVDPGVWSLMATGVSFFPGETFNPFRPSGFPGHLDPWCKLAWRWITPVEVTRNIGTVTIAPYTDQPSAYRLWAFGSSNQDEYFLVVNRQLRGFDRFLPSGGLNIFHVDRAILKDPLRYLRNTVQMDRSHKAIDLEDADGRDDMDFAVPKVQPFDWTRFGFGGWEHGNFGDDGDPFPGRSGKRNFDFQTVPSSISYRGQDSGVRVLDINPQGDGTIQVTLKVEVKPQVIILSPRNGEQTFTSRPTLQVQFLAPFGAPPDIDPATISILVDGQSLPIAPGSFNETKQFLFLPLTDPQNPDQSLRVGGHTVQVQAQNRAGISTDPVSLNFSVATFQLSRGAGLPIIMVTAPYDFSRAPAGHDTPAFVLGIPNPRIARWGVTNPVGKQYGYLTTGEFVNRFVPGRAYWVKLDRDVFLSIDAPDVDRSQPFRIANESVWDLNDLDFGWQQIGNPFPFIVDSSAIQVILPSGEILSLTDAVQRRVILGRVYRWTGTDYESIPAQDWLMLPFVGYWVYKLQSLSFLISPTPSSRSWRYYEQSRRNHQVSLELEIFGEGAVLPYRLSLKRNDEQIPAPPPTPGMTAWAYLKDMTNSNRQELGMKEIPLSRNGKWIVYISSLQPNQNVTLRWRGYSSALQGYQVSLSDLQSHKSVSLKQSGEMKFTTDENGRKVLLLQILSVANMPLRIVDVKVTRLRGKGFAIIASSTASSEWRAEIKTLTGRTVYTLPVAEGMRSSVQLFWDGKGNDGKVLPKTTLLLYLKAKDNFGRETQRVVVLR